MTTDVNGLKVNIHFYDDWAEYLCLELKNMGYTLPDTLESSEKALAYFNVMARKILPLQRNLITHPSFSCPSDLIQGFDLLKEESEKGNNLLPRQSRSMKKYDYYDGLLFDWGIHHFHLGTTIESDGFFNRTGPVLFCMVDDVNIYCIDILIHDKDVWAERNLLEVVEANWPDLIKNHRLGWQNVFPKFTDSQYLQMRKAGASMLVELKSGNVYFSPGGGYATAGNSMAALRSHDSEANALGTAMRFLRDNAGKFILEIIKSTGYAGNAFDFHLRKVDDDWHGFESNTGELVMMFSQES